METLFSITHGDWYEDQKNQNIDNYDEYQVIYNPTNMSFRLKCITLRSEYSEGGYTIDEIIEQIKYRISKKNRQLIDYTYTEWQIKKYPNLKEAFLELSLCTKKD